MHIFCIVGTRQLRQFDGLSGSQKVAPLSQPSVPLLLLVFSAEDLIFYFIRKIEAKLTSLLTEA